MKMRSEHEASEETRRGRSLVPLAGLLAGSDAAAKRVTSAPGQCAEGVLALPKLNSPTPLRLPAMLPSILRVLPLPPVRPYNAAASPVTPRVHKFAGRKSCRAAARYTQAAALKMRCRAASISPAEKAGWRLRCRTRNNSSEASSVSRLWPDAEMSMPRSRSWWSNQPPQPIARLRTASCSARAPGEGVCAATSDSSNSRHRSTRSSQDTTCAAPSEPGAWTRPANRPAKRPVTPLSSVSAIATLILELCQRRAHQASGFLECSTNLTDPSCFWCVAMNLPGQADLTTFIHTNAATAGACFYRVGVHEP